MSTSTPLIETVKHWEFQEVSQKPPLVAYLRALWERRHFIWADAQAKAFATSRGTLLGKAWLVVRPFIDGLIYFFIFGILVGTNRGIENFPAYLVIGVNFFTLMSSALGGGHAIITGSRNLIRAFAFPRFSLVLSWAIRTLLDFLPVLGATIVFILVMPPGVGLHPTMLLIVPLVAIGWVMMLGLASNVAALTVSIPDLKFIWPLLARLWFYVSGVFFAFEVLIDDRVLLAVLSANPGYIFLHMARQVLIYHEVPPIYLWTQMMIWAVGFLITGLILFWQSEESYGRD